MRRFILTAVAVVWFVSRAGAVDFGWQTVSGGGIEYIVQVEPDLIDSFRQEGFTSEVPAGLRDIRRIRIEVGSGRLPNQGDLKGPTIAAATPPTDEPKESDQNSQAAPPETFGQAKQKATPPAADSAADNTAGAPPLLDSTRPVPPLPFFQSGPAKSISPKADNAVVSDAHHGEQDLEASTVRAGASSKTAGKAEGPGKPGLQPDEGAPIAATKNIASDRRIVEAGMAAAPGEGEGAANNSPRATDAKPWGIFVLVVLGLFASLGANVYLAWIHQGVRAKYQTLAAQMHGGASA